MGLNMPAKTVVFTAVKKWDGDSHRFIGSGEYIQVSNICVVSVICFICWLSPDPSSYFLLSTMFV